MAEYKITRIVKLVDIDERGRFKYFYRIHFTFNDIEDFVDIPEEEYSEAKARELIEARVKEHKALLK